MADTPYEKAREDALNRLDRRMYSRAQLLGKLKQRGHEQEVCQQVLDRLEELGLIDDMAFGRALIRQQTLRKPAGERLLSSKLWQKGIKQSLIDQLLSEWRASSDYDPCAGAVDLAQKKLTSSSIAQLEPAKRQQKLQRLLARRGFSWDVIRQAIDKVNRDNT